MSGEAVEVVEVAVEVVAAGEVGVVGAVMTKWRTL